MKGHSPCPQESPHCHQYKPNIHTPRQKIETTLCQVLMKEKAKRKKIKVISCLCGATLIGNSSQPCSSLEFENCAQGLSIHNWIQQSFAKETLQLFNHICFYFKGKFWEVNFTKGVAPHIEGCFPSMRVMESSTRSFSIDLSVTFEEVPDLDKFYRVLCLWGHF